VEKLGEEGGVDRLASLTRILAKSPVVAVAFPLHVSRARLVLCCGLPRNQALISR
jgi:hypothetical protein